MRLLKDKRVNAAVRMQAAAKLMDTALARELAGLGSAPAPVDQKAPAPLLLLDPRKAGEVLSQRIREQR